MEIPSNVYLPIITLLIGYATKAVSDWLDFRRLSEREREAREESRRDRLFERHNTFQRQTLLDLQEALMQLTRSSAAINHQDVMAYRKTGKWQKQLLGDDLSEGNRVVIARVSMLSVRVRDKALRDLVRDLKDDCAKLGLCESEAESRSVMKGVLELFAIVNEQIGQILRDIDAENWDGLPKH
jgi:hypothetical protein